MNDTQSKIVVFGGTGFYGRKVVEKLLLKGQAVRVVSRNSDAARKRFGNRVEIFQGDVTDRWSIVHSLAHASAIVICLSAMSNKLIRKIRTIERDAVITIIKEAKKANIPRLVYMSGYEMRERLLNQLRIPELGAIKIEIESILSQSDLNWTILGDAPAFEIFFAFIRNNKMIVPGGGYNAIPCISADDVGEIAAQAALRNDLKGRRIKLTGPEAFSFPQAAERISLFSGKTIKHMTIPLAVVNGASWLMWPVAPFFRYLYKSLKMLNNFPVDLAEAVPREHERLRELFDYEPHTLEMEIQKRFPWQDGKAHH